MTPKENNSEDKKKSLEFAINQISKDFGKEAIMKLGDRTVSKISTIPTGAITLDIALGVGGLPRGRIIEIFGPEASGKTTLALHVIAESQKQKGISAFVDAEHALDPLYAKKIGVDIDNLLITQPDSGEQALEITERLIRSGAVDIIVIDSVAALVPKAEIEGEMGDQHVGLQARLMSQALRKLTAITSSSKTVVIFINQLRHKVGVMFGNPETTPGGMALKFYSSVRLDIRKIENIKQEDIIVGSKIRVKVVKNKVAPPYRTAEFEMINGVGISKMKCLIDAGIEVGIINKNGSWFEYANNKLGQGYDNAVDYLNKNPNISQEILNKVKEKVDNVN